jgi:hypothetical protein
LLCAVGTWNLGFVWLHFNPLQATCIGVEN